MTRLRPARATDADGIADLERLHFGADAWTPPQVTAELSHDLRHGWVAVAEDDRELVGYVVLLVVGGTVDLQRIAVLPAHRRRGVARDLLAAALAGADAGTAAGPSRLLLEVRADNTAGRAFYRSLGCRQVAVRRRYYADGQDAVVLEARLTPAPGLPPGR